MTHDDERTGAIEIPLAQTVSSFSKGHRTGLAFSLVVTMAAAAAAAAITRRHILCLGDSLTEGYYSWGMKFHPYARRLQEHLDGLGMGSFHLTNAGVSGETSEEILARLPQALQALPPGEKFEIVIILAGTNDLGYCETATTMNNLLQMHRMCHEEERAARFIRDKRLQLNRDLTAFAKALSPKTALADIAMELPHLSLPESQRDQYWDDGIHPNPAGYDRMGDIFFKAVRALLSATAADGVA